MTSTSAASEPATRADLEALRLELGEDMGTLRTELRGDMGTLRTEMREDMAAQNTALRQDMAEFRADLRTWTAVTIGLSSAILVGTIGAIVTVAFVG